MEFFTKKAIIIKLLVSGSHWELWTNDSHSTVKPKRNEPLENKDSSITNY